MIGNAPIAAEAPVVIAGGGPVGCALAIDLALRNVRSIVLERRSADEPFVARANMTNVRSMEHLRRWGMADALRRNDPVSEEVQRDVLFVTRLNGKVLLHLPRTYEWTEPLPFASEVAEWAPNQAIETTFWDRVRELDLIDYRFGHEVVDLVQDDAGVTVEAVAGEGPVRIRGQYLAVADGSRSRIRRDVMNIRMEGDPNLGRSCAWYFRAPSLPKLWRAGPLASMVYFYNEDRAADLFVAQGGLDRWLYYSSPLPDGVDGQDFEQVRRLIYRAVGAEFEIEVLHGSGFDVHSLRLPSMVFGRVAFMGDAAHLVSPQGGFGMNLGISDAADLGWKLAALIHGWGGPMLLASYSVERLEATRFIQEGTIYNQRHGSPELVRDGIEDEGPEGDAVRAQVLQDIKDKKLVQFARMGGQLGYRYATSPIVVPDDTREPPPTFREYTPSARPGNRAPHHWMTDGSSLYDHIGWGFTLLDLGGLDSGPLVEAAAARRIPLDVFSPDEPDRSALRELYQAGGALIRSDHHVAWRGDDLPDDPTRLIDIVTGSLAWARSQATMMVGAGA